MAEENIKEEIEKRIIKSFLDLIILQVLNEGGSASGYDIMLFLGKRFHQNFSSGTVYAAIYSLQRKGYITGLTEARKTIYEITESGKEVVRIVQDSEKEFRKLRVGAFNINNKLLKQL